MKEFWKWMEEKEYGDNLSARGEDLYGYGFYPPDQMLIGYMIEYLIEKREEKKVGSLVIGLILQIDELYEELKKYIEEIK